MTKLTIKNLKLSIDKKDELKSSSDKVLKEQAIKRRKKENEEIISTLCKTFPKCFSLSRPLPLKLGIEVDLFESLHNYSKSAIRRVLKYYTRSFKYLHAFEHHSHRVDLSGNKAEEISEAEKVFAKKQIESIREKINETDPAPKVPTK